MANAIPFNLPFDSETIRYVQEFAICLGIGLLIGLEREFSKSSDPEHKQSFAGIRTFTLTAIYGYLAAILSGLIHPAFYLVAFAGLAVLLSLGYVYSARNGDHGGTSEMAQMLTFLLPALVFYGSYLGAVTIAVLLTFILAQKLRIHQLIRQMNKQEIVQILLFLVLTVLLLPLLPDENFGPYGIFNLYRNWMVVAIFMALHFFTYFLGKFLAPERSIVLTGILGGLASSTATAWYFSKYSRNQPESGYLAITAIILASSLMFIRMLVWLLLLNPSLLATSGIVIGLLALSGIGIGLWFYTRKKPIDTTTIALPVSNPVNVRDALVFTMVFLAFRWMVAYAGERYGSNGVYWASILAGITDIDAITISLADGLYSLMTPVILTKALLLAAMTNTLVKFLLCISIGSPTLRIQAIKAFAPILIIGIVAFFLI